MKELGGCGENRRGTSGHKGAARRTDVKVQSDTRATLKLGCPTSSLACVTSGKSLIQSAPRSLSRKDLL